MLENPYQKIYKSLNLQHGTQINQKQAQNIIKHLGFMYNTFGQAIKDFVRIIGNQFQQRIQRNEFTSTNLRSQTKYIIDDQSHRPTEYKNNQHIHKEVYNIFSTAKNETVQLQIQQKEGKQFSARFQKDGLYLNKQSFYQQSSTQILLEDSPMKQPSQQFKSSSLFQLSHKQRFQDSSFIVIEQESQKDFILNKETQKDKSQQSQSAKLGFKLIQSKNVRINGGRKKKDRQKLMGVTCIQCQKYYKIMNTKGQSMCECTSRHRTNLPVKRIKNQFTQQFDLK